jgi:cobalamin biosynthesis protein CobT
LHRGRRQGEKEGEGEGEGEGEVEGEGEGEEEEEEEEVGEEEEAPATERQTPSKDTPADEEEKRDRRLNAFWAMCGKDQMPLTKKTRERIRLDFELFDTNHDDLLDLSELQVSPLSCVFVPSV